MILYELWVMRWANQRRNQNKGNARLDWRLVSGHLKKVNDILTFNIANQPKKASENAPKLTYDGFSSARRCDPDRAQASARTRSSLESKIKFFPLHKKRGEKNLFAYIQTINFTLLNVLSSPVSKAQSKGRAISNGASFAELVTLWTG